MLRTSNQQVYKLQVFISYITFFGTFRSLQLTNFVLSFQFFTLFQITLPKCHKIYPNCIWHVTPEWHCLNFDSALLTKVYWNYATPIVRVCVSSKSPVNPNLPFTKKSNLQVIFRSGAMARLFERLCHHSLTNNDLLLDELLSCLPSRFPLHIFDYIAYEISDNESVRSVDSSVSVFYSNVSIYFSQVVLLLNIFSYATPSFYHTDRHKTVKKGRRPRTTDDPKEGPKTLQFKEPTGRGKQVQLLRPFSYRPGGEQPLPAVKTCQQVVAREVGRQLTYKDLPRRLNQFLLPLRAPCTSTKSPQI